MLTKGGLQTKLRKLGLDTHGKKADLKKRLDSAHQARHPVSATQQHPSDTDSNSDTEAAVMVSTTCPLMDDTDMQFEAARSIEAEVRSGLEVEAIGNNIAVGNSRGLNVLNELRLLRVDFERDSAKIRLLEQQNGDLNGQVSNLKVSLSDYEALRNRFIATYKRDKLGTATPADHKLIKNANQNVRGGDVKFDSKLYLGAGGRTDRVAFKALYGQDPWTVPSIQDPAVIAMMNQHASVVASKYKPFSSVFEDKFIEFISELENADYAPIDLAAPPTKLSKAYLDFQQVLKTEVSTVPVEEEEV